MATKCLSSQQPSKWPPHFSRRQYVIQTMFFVFVERESILMNGGIALASENSTNGRYRAYTLYSNIFVIALPSPLHHPKNQTTQKLVFKSMVYIVRGNQGLCFLGAILNTHSTRSSKRCNASRSMHQIVVEEKSMSRGHASRIHPGVCVCVWLWETEHSELLSVIRAIFVAEDFRPVLVTSSGT